MANEKNATQGALLRELFQVGVYKRSQGRIARQATAFTLVVVVAIGAWRLSEYMLGYSRPVQFGVPAVLFLVGAWLSYRLVNIPSFADFLIAVEAEMNKVSWPSKTELWRSVIVVIVSIVFLGAILWIYDYFWSFLLHRVLGI